MKSAALVATTLFSLATPVASVHAESAIITPKQAVCVPVIVETDEGFVEGVLCFSQGGRV